jgi:hypothetical protein
LAEENQRRTSVLDQERAAMANRPMEQSADALKSLIATEANRRHLCELLDLGIEFDLPTDLSDLLDALDKAEERAISDRREHH